MNIETGTTITVTFSMTEAEARAILVDPRDFQDALRSALAVEHRTNGRKQADLATKSPGRPRRTPGRKRFLSRAPRRSDRTPLPCPECSTEFNTAQGLAVHRARAHGVRRATAPAADDASPE
jgi:hypothetical protein